MLLSIHVYVSNKLIQWTESKPLTIDHFYLLYQTPQLVDIFTNGNRLWNTQTYKYANILLVRTPFYSAHSTRTPPAASLTFWDDQKLSWTRIMGVYQYLGIIGWPGGIYDQLYCAIADLKYILIKCMCLWIKHTYVFLILVYL